MLSHANLFDIYYKVDRKSTKLDNECLTLLYNIKKKLGIKVENDFGILGPPKQTHKFVNNNIDASLDKVIGTLRTNINKLSDKTFDKLSENIVSIIKNYDDNVFFKDVTGLLFNIVSKNKLNCNLFSRMYAKLCETNSHFKIILVNEVDTYCSSFDNITYVSPNEDYDKYCEYVKLNDNKIALSLFFLECFRQGLLDASILTGLIQNTIELFKIHISHKENHNVCESIINNIYVLLKGLHVNQVDEASNLINELVNCDFKSCASFNNKIRFKIMDIKDILK